MQRHEHWRTRTTTVLIAAVIGTAALVAAWTACTVGAGEKSDSPPETTNAKPSAQEKDLRAIAAAYTRAFNAGNATEVAAHWAPDGDFVDASGTLFRGRDAIAKEFAIFFAENPGVRVEIDAELFRFPAANVAIEDGVARLRSASGIPASTSRYTITHIQKDGKWLMASVREMPHQATSNYDHLRELEWLIGAWIAKSGKRTVDQTGSWVSGQNFLIRQYVVKDGNSTVKEGMQMIGWDPLGDRIRSWVFTTDGGFSEEKWSFNGKSWSVDATGVQRDGSKTQATNLITRVNDNTYTWQSVNRSIDGVGLPETAVVTLTRVVPKK